MNANLYLKELKRNRKNLIIWTFIVIGFTLMILSIFPYMKEIGSDMSNLMDKMPTELKKAMGMDANTWNSILGFYNTYYGIYIILLIGIFTTSTGASIISKEEKDKTAEFLLTQPITRKTIFVSKILTLLTLTFLIYSIQIVIAISGILIFNEAGLNWQTFAIMHTHGLVLIIFFTSIGVILSMFIKPKKNFMGPIIGIIFGSYFIDAMSKTADTINWLGFISPFHYLDFEISRPDYALNLLPIITLLTISSTLLIFAYHIYNKRDISI